YAKIVFPHLLLSLFLNQSNWVTFGIGNQCKSDPGRLHWRDANLRAKLFGFGECSFEVRDFNVENQLGFALWFVANPKIDRPRVTVIRRTVRSAAYIVFITSFDVPIEKLRIETLQSLAIASGNFQISNWVAHFYLRFDDSIHAFDHRRRKARERPHVAHAVPRV